MSMRSIQDGACPTRERRIACPTLESPTLRPNLPPPGARRQTALQNPFAPEPPAPFPAAPQCRGRARSAKPEIPAAALRSDTPQPQPERHAPERCADRAHRSPVCERVQNHALKTRRPGWRSIRARLNSGASAPDAFSLRCAEGDTHSPSVPSRLSDVV